MSGMRVYDRDHLHTNIVNDHELVVIVPRTAYFTLNGQPMAWVVPETASDNDMLDIIETVQGFVTGKI